MKYRHKNNGQVGEVIHYKGITTTLKLEDGKETILTKANLRRYWELIEDDVTEEKKEVKEQPKKKEIKTSNVVNTQRKLYHCWTLRKRGK